MQMILLAVLLGQTALQPPTALQTAGATAAASTAVIAVQTASRAHGIIGGDPNTACIYPANVISGSAVTVRIGVAVLSAQAQVLLGLPNPTEPAYAVVEVRAVASGVPLQTVIPGIAFLDDPVAVYKETDLRPSALAPACEVAVWRSDAALVPFRCACSTGSSCTWTNPTTHVSETAPKGRTLTPDTSWTGTGCVPKACYNRLMPGSPDETWPSACPTS